MKLLGIVMIMITRAKVGKRRKAHRIISLAHTPQRAHWLAYSKT